jgi:hypothetical protein
MAVKMKCDDVDVPCVLCMYLGCCRRVCLFRMLRDPGCEAARRRINQIEAGCAKVRTTKAKFRLQRATQQTEQQLDRKPDEVGRERALDVGRSQE